MAQSLYRQASLVMNPYGAKDDLLPSIKPTDGSGDFTFSRDGAGASPATRVNASGLIEKGRTNEISWSNDFSKASWVKTDSSVTSGQSGYDGTNNAWLLSKSAANGRLIQNLSAGAVLTFSVYAKAGTLNYMRLRVSGTSNSSCFFDFTDGSIHNNDGFDASMEDVGGGWYRCSYTFNSTITGLQIYPADSTSSVAGTSGNILIQDAQIETSLVATEIIDTEAPTSAGLLGDMPRLDYSGGATCPSLLLEPSRVNVLDHSEYFDAWIKGNISVANNVSTSPEGVQNATTIDVVSDASFSSLRRNISVSANSTYTMSLFVKKETSETNYMGLGFVYSGGTTDVGYVIIDSVNGTALSADPRIDVITNVVDFGDYWRIEATATDSGSNTSLAVYIYATLSTDGTNVGVGVGSVRTIYGAQLESGSYPTSYIPTYGSASTRAGDFNGITDTIADDSLLVFNSGDDFTLFFDGSFNDVSSTSNMLMGGGKQSFGANYQSYFWVVNGGEIRLSGTSEAVMGKTFSFSIADNTRYKILAKRSGSTISFFVNGVKGTTTSSTSPNAEFILRSIGWSYSNGNYNVSGDMNQALVFNSALTDAECIALTTI